MKFRNRGKKSLYIFCNLACIFVLFNSFAFADITGVVFEDYASDGGITTRDRGIGGVLVTAYDSNNNSVGSATSYSFFCVGAGLPDASCVGVNSPQAGSYTIPISVPGSYRVEISNFPLGSYPSPQGSDNLGSVQFVADNASANFALNNPINHCEDDPTVVAACFAQNDPLVAGDAAAIDTLVSFPYSSSGDGTPAGPSPAQHDAFASQTGSVHGLAFKRDTRQLFASALVKRHAGLGPLGEGGIYVVDYTNPAAPVLTNFVDLTNDLGISVGTVGTGATPQLRNVSRGLTGNPVARQLDSDAFVKVGRVGLGDIDISEDGNSLFVMNLFDRTVYEISTTAPATLINSFPVPDPGCALGESRPFALKYYKGELYAGIVCDATISLDVADLDAHIVKLNHAAGATSFGTSLIAIDLDYDKGAIGGGSCATNPHTNWHPWHDDINNVLQACFSNIYGYPTPIFADIEFDDDGSAILGFADRSGHQYSWRNFEPNSTTATVAYFGGGDVLRVGVVDGVYTLENAGVVTTELGTYTSVGIGSSNPVAPNDRGAQGPGGIELGLPGANQGEFYSQDNLRGHNETALGALAVLPGSAEVAVTSYDPVGTEVLAGGLNFFSNINGESRETGYMIYFEPNVGSPTLGFFGKAVGIGDVELLCEVAPLEIGNYIWFDSDNDGVADPDELPIVGLTVNLYDALGNVVASTVTDAQGNYIFNAGNVSSGLLPNTDYVVRIDNSSDFSSGGVLENYVLTQVGGSATSNALNDMHDSDGVMADSLSLGAIFPEVSVTTGATGENNHSLDFGFMLEIQIGNYIWLDTNGDGIQDATEPPIPGVTVSLFNKTTGAFITNAITDANGQYLFDIAANTDFTIKLDNPADYASGGPLEGLSLTLQDSGNDDTLDSDAMDMGGFAAIMGTSPLTGVDLSFDFGFTDLPVDPTFPGVANGPTFFFWNTNLGIMNVASMLNGGGSFFDSVITTFSNDGSFNGQTGSWIYPDGNSDVVLNNLPANSFGIGLMDLVPTTSASTYDGLIAQYRFAPDGNEIEFAKFSPFIQSTSGTKYLIYNTFQPSLNPTQAGNQVTVWAEVANPDQALAQSFIVNMYTTSGVLASSQNITVPPSGRVDVQAGHETPGASNQGLVEVIPVNPGAPFIAQISRYGADVPSGIAPSSFSFATADVGSNGFTSQIVAPVSSGGGAQNWVVVTNTAAVPTTAQVEFLDYNGNVVQSSTAALPANGQATFDAATLFPGGTSGVVKVTPLGAEPIIADSMFYFFKFDGSVSAAYISQAEPNYALPKYGSYNTFLGQQNWLKLFNNNSVPVTVTVSVNQLGLAAPAVLLGSTTVTLQPNSGIDAELIETLGFAIPADTFGTVEVNAPTSGLYAEILRIRPLGGFIDLAKAVPVR